MRWLKLCSVGTHRYTGCLRCYSECISTPSELEKYMPGHGGNRTYDLWNTSPMLCQLSYAVRSVRVSDISEQSLTNA